MSRYSLFPLPLSAYIFHMIASANEAAVTIQKRALAYFGVGYLICVQVGGSKTEYLGCRRAVARCS